MKVYLAASFSRQSEMRDVAVRLADIGVEVTSRWLVENQSIHSGTGNKFMRECALTDVEDVQDAQILVRFADDLHFPLVASHLATGARHFEMGLAWGRGMPVIVVGGRQHAFDYLPNIIHLKDTESLIRYLSQEEIQ